MNDLKKVFNAARSIREHTLPEAASELGVSLSFLNKYLAGESSSAPMEARIKKYISDTGIVKSINDLGLDPKQPAKNLQPANS